MAQRYPGPVGGPEYGRLRVLRRRFTSVSACRTELTNRAGNAVTG